MERRLRTLKKYGLKQDEKHTRVCIPKIKMILLSAYQYGGFLMLGVS